jgi:hypothetical protein
VTAPSRWIYSAMSKYSPPDLSQHNCLQPNPTYFRSRIILTS